MVDPEEIRTFRFSEDKNKVIYLHGTYQHPEKTVFTLNDYSNACFNKTSPHREKYIKNSISELVEYFQNFAQELKESQRQNS